MEEMESEKPGNMRQSPALQAAIQLSTVTLRDRLLLS